MFNFKEIEFMKLYVSILYKNGFCYFDLSKEYLDGYLHELKKLMQFKKFSLDNSGLRNIFLYDKEAGNYTNLIKLLLYVTNNPVNSFYSKEANILMVNFNEEIVERNLSKTYYMDIDIVSTIVDYMICYLNQDVKIKIISK